MPGTLPTNSAHLSDLARSEMIEQYSGVVDSQYAKDSFFRRFVDVRSVQNTDTLINRRVGKTTLQKVTPGVRPDANATPFGRVAVTVDTVVLARDNRSMLNEFQTDFNARAELGKDHGKQIAKFTDEAFVISAIKSAYLPAPSGLNGAIGAGKVKNLTAANDEYDPDVLYAAIAGIITQMQEEDIDTDRSVVMVRPTIEEVLLNNDKLISRDFSADNGDFATGRIKTVKGCPIVKTARIPQAAITGHYLSNLNNTNWYDLTAAQAKAVAVVIHPDTLLAGETIPLTSNVHWSETELQWFIDSYLSFGMSNRRPDGAGVVNRF